MIEMLDELSKHLRVAKNIKGEFFGGSPETEINGELLQILTRIYWMTGKARYLDWAIEIGDHYLLGNNIQLHNADRLRLRDHGCEIVGGLSELYATLHFTGSDKKNAYQPNFYRLLDRILEIAINEDGLFYNEVNMQDGAIIDSTIVDNWGYIYNAYYTVFLIDNKTEYRDAVLKPLAILNQKYRNFNWEKGSADGFADAIESGINLYNREKILELADWINSEIKVMWSLQDSSYLEKTEQWRNMGIIEGWHGDGNFARTTIMYCLWKTNGITIEPWREDVVFGAVERKNSLYIALKAKKRWEGTINFDQERHKKVFNLPIDYPRINQFPEWYTIDEQSNYRLHNINKNSKEKFKGSNLNGGLSVKLDSNLQYMLKVTKE